MRRWIRSPARTEAGIFDEYARNDLGLDAASAKKFRRLCLLSEDAVYFGQHSDVADISPWWLRDQYFSAVRLGKAVEKGQLAALLKEKKDNLKRWDEIVELANGLSFPDARQTRFVRVTCAYGRFKYRLAEIVFRTQGFLAEVEAGARRPEKEEARRLLAEFEGEWAAWERLRAAEPDCPTLYEYASFEKSHSEPLFGKSLQRLRDIAGAEL